MMALTEKEMDCMRVSGKITSDALKYAETLIKPGISTLRLDNLIEKYIISKVEFLLLKIIMVFLTPYVHLLMKWLFMAFLLKIKFCKRVT